MKLDNINYSIYDYIGNAFEISNISNKSFYFNELNIFLLKIEFSNSKIITVKLMLN